MLYQSPMKEIDPRTIRMCPNFSQNLPSNLSNLVIRYIVEHNILLNCMFYFFTYVASLRTCAVPKMLITPKMTEKLWFENRNHYIWMWPHLSTFSKICQLTYMALLLVHWKSLRGTRMWPIRILTFYEILEL